MQFVHLLFGILNAPVGLDKLHKPLYLLLGHGLSLHLGGQLAHLGVLRGHQHVYGRQSELAFGHIVARRFAYFRRIVVVKDVVTYLKHDAEVLPELLCGLYLTVRRSCRQRSDGATSLEKGCGLLLYHLIISLFRDGLVVYVGQLQYLAARQCASQFGQILHYLLIIRERNVQKRRRQQIIARKYGHFVVVNGIHRGLSSALVAVVNHVVVHQTGRVKQFQAHRSVLCHVGNHTVVLGHQQDEHRAHALSGLLLYVLQNLREHSVSMSQRLVEQIYKVGKVFLYRFAYQR